MRPGATPTAAAPTTAYNMGVPTVIIITRALGLVTHAHEHTHTRTHTHISNAHRAGGADELIARGPRAFNGRLR